MRAITLPDNEKFIIGSDRDIENVVADFCGEEFATALMEHIGDLRGQADYETQKFNSDMGAYEAENETFRTTLTKEETSYDYVYSSYCPHCGAKMDGDTNGS